MSDILEKSVIALAVPKSIVSGTTTNPIDFNQPLTFTEWIVRTNPTETDSAYLVSQYKLYLLKWYKVKKIDSTSTNDYVKSSFIGFLREVVLNYTTLEERRFITNADLTNDLDLLTVVPIFAQKIKDICNYYALLRQSVSFKKYANNLKGSQSGVVSLLKNEIYKSLQSLQISSNKSNLFSLSSVKNNLKIEIKELFDESQYFDLNPTLSAATYNPGFSSQYYSSNLNDINSKLYTDFDQTIIDAIKAYPFFLNDFKTTYSVNVQVTAEDLQYLRDKDFINQINNNDKTNLNLNLEKELIENFIGTDYYYVSTGSTQTNFVSGLLFKSQDKASNFLNKRFPSVASVQDENNLKTIREIGGYFLPDKLGVLNFNNFKFNIEIDEKNLEPNKVYIFPDPYKYGNISNISKTDFISPIIYEEDVSWMHYNRSAQYLYANVVSNPLYKNFYAYHSRSESVGYEPYGMSRDIDSTEFFTGSSKDIWNNSDIFPVQENVLPIDDRQLNLLTINQTLVKYKNDIYGNNYGLYKEVNPVGVGLDGLNRGDFISQDELDFFNFTGGRGGPKGTGRKGLNYNQFSEIKSERSKPCLIIDGYAYYDLDEGFDFNYGVPNPKKRVSGVTSRTITQIPPGSGYFAAYNRLSAYPDPYIYYNISYPYSAPPTFKPIPTPLLLIAYGKGHFVDENGEDTFCDVFNVGYCQVLDCITFLSNTSGALIDVPSDLPAWNTSIPVYYSELLESSLNTFYAKPTDVNRATFSYTFAPSAQVLTDLEAFRFNLQGQTPCNITNSVTQVGPGTLDYNYDMSEFINLQIPDVYKTTVQSVSTTLTRNKTIYETRNETVGTFYYKNANTSYVDLVSNALSSIFVKYPTKVYDSVKQGVITFDLIYNVIFIETRDYFIIDKIDYNYENNTVEPYNSDKNFLTTYILNKNIEKISNIFFNEKTNEVVFTRMVLLPELSASNTKLIYPEVYRLDVSDPIVRKLYPNFETNTSTLSNFIHVDSSINIEKIDKPIISYNEDTNTYLINYLAKDSNNVFCNIFEEFVITNSNIKFLNYVCYKPEYYIQDYNFTYNYSNTAIRFNNLTANLSCYQDLSRSILWFGASSIPVNIVPGFITCDTGIVFDEIVITPDPTPTVTPTPTITPTPTPTPTVPDWYNTCYTHRVCVFGSPISELNAVYTLTAGYYDSISGVPIFSTVYANDNNSKILIKFNPDNQVLHGAILSAYDDDFNSYTFFYGSTSAVPDYTCVPYGVYNTRVVYEPYLDATITFTGPAPYPTVSFYSIT